MAVLFPKPIPILRRSGQYVAGIWTESSSAGFVAQGSCQPVSGRAIEALPVNRRDIGQIKVYTNERLEPSTEGSTNPGDIVVWDGRLWEVWESQPNSNNLISHYKSLAQYIGEAS